MSESTVYRHFPDRQALLSGLTARLGTLMGGSRITDHRGSLESVEQLPPAATEGQG